MKILLYYTPSQDENNIKLKLKALKINFLKKRAEEEIILSGGQYMACFSFQHSVDVLSIISKYDQKNNITVLSMEGSFLSLKSISHSTVYSNSISTKTMMYIRRKLVVVIL